MSTDAPVLDDDIGVGDYQFGFHDPTDKYVFQSRRGLDRAIVEQISEMKSEPEWMRKFRLDALDIFFQKPLPNWGGDLSDLDFQNMFYYVKASQGQEKSWDDVPDDIRKTYDRLGIPEAEKKYLAGVKAQYESEVVYGSLQEDLAKQGVIFTDTDSALRDYPDLVREYFGTVIPSADNKFAALNSAVWSGGSFIYIPKGVKIEFPLQAYFRINTQNMGQFERTLIIVDEGASVHYVEGCTAPTYSSDSLHSAVVEILVKRGGALSLYHDPELVEQRLQSGHQAGKGIRRFTHGMGRRKPGFEVDDEVSGHLSDGTGCAGRNPVNRVCRQGTASGRGSQDGSLRSSYVQPSDLEEYFQRWWSRELSRIGEGDPRCPSLQEQRGVRCIDSRFAQPQRYLPVYRSEPGQPDDRT